MPFNISRFKSTLDKYGGPARGSLFEVTITKNFGEKNSAISGREFTFFCNRVNFPGIAINNNTFNAVGQMPQQFPSTMNNAPINATFLVDSNHQILTFFHNWIQRVLNYSTRGGTFSAIGPEESPGDLQLPYELGYKDEYACTITIKHYSTEGRSSKFYEVVLENAYPFNIGDLDFSWDQESQYMALPVSFAYDRIYYSGDNTGKQTRFSGRGVLETLGDLAGFADVVRQTVNQGRPQSIQDAVNRLNRFQNSFDRLTDFFDDSDG